MTESTDRKYLEMRERQARDWLLRHYQDIGAPAIAAALDVAVGPEKKLEKSAPERLGVMPSFLLADDHAA
jgi:hypothetical protein